MNRRSVMSLIAGAPVAAKRLASDLVQGAGKMSEDAAGAADQRQRPRSWSDGAEGAKAIEPRMPRWQAARAVLGDPEARAQATAFFYERHRVVTYIDPDIEIMRSWSPMAKIAFPRQRNVERDLASMTAEPMERIYEKLHEKIGKLVWG